jgi:hypothetical protein
LTTLLDLAALNDPAREQATLAADLPALVTDQWSILDPALMRTRLAAVSGLAFDNFDAVDWQAKAIAKINAAPAQQ